MKLIDTHCHLYHSLLEPDIEAVMQRSLEMGVNRILMPAINRASIQEMRALPVIPGLSTFTMAGIHPCDVHEAELIQENELVDWAKKVNAIAIGETGLDYYWSKDHIELQKASLQTHLTVAKSLDLPIVLHNRNSTNDFLSMIEEAQDGSLKGVWHCFNGSIEEGKRAIDLGLYLGIGGVITFKNGGMDKVIPHLPSNRFILETDSPYLTPKPYRGKRNEPSYLSFVQSKLSELIGLDNDEIAKLTSANAEKLFSL